MKSWWLSGLASTAHPLLTSHCLSLPHCLALSSPPHLPLLSLTLSPLFLSSPSLPPLPTTTTATYLPKAWVFVDVCHDVCVFISPYILSHSSDGDGEDDWWLLWCYSVRLPSLHLPLPPPHPSFPFYKSLPLPCALPFCTLFNWYCIPCSLLLPRPTFDLHA